MDCQKLLDLLARESLDLDFNIYSFDLLTSTNEKLAQLIAEENSPSGTIVIAKKQTAGRGQRGRKWDSDEGGLYLSLAISPDLVARFSSYRCASIDDRYYLGDRSSIETTRAASLD